MTAYIIGLASVALFALLLKLGGLVGVSRRIISETTASAAVMRDTSLADDIKEKQLQRGSIAVFKGFFQLLLVVGVALLIPTLCVLGLEWLGLVDPQQVSDSMLSWHFLLLACALSCLFFIRPGKRKQRNV